jgi:single-stranded DNA-specific DHH superfamily exonuclease
VAGQVSIRAPRSRTGRHRGQRNGADLQRVSIRAPRSRTGRLDSTWKGIVSIKFQSAPRARARGDCGPANRQRRKLLLHHPREDGDISRVQTDSIVKEQRKRSDFIAVLTNRETPGFESALGVRAPRRVIADSQNDRSQRISGSVKSTGLATPWCSVRVTAFSSRK